MFLDELKQKLENNTDKIFSTKITMLNDYMVIVEGYKKLLKYEDTLISFGANKIYNIEGKNLKIDAINQVELLINGNIESIKLSK